MYILIAILLFGILIATHELGHFLAAKACGVRVNEFAIGMGPAIWKKQKGETLYAFRCLPLGGYCAMEGENGDSDDPAAFAAKAAWKRAVILLAGPAMNFLFGFLIAVILTSGAAAFVGSTVTAIEPDFAYAENGLAVGDEILAINGAGVHYSGDFTFEMSRSDGAVDMLVRRGGEKIMLENYPLQKAYFKNADGTESYRYGISFNLLDATLGEKLRYSFFRCCQSVRMVFIGLGDLVTGRAGVNDLSGVVGIVGTINDVGTAAPTRAIALENIASIASFIAINLGVMNLLPLPALDGGRIFALVITTAIEAVTKKKVDPKYEGMIHTAGLLLLVGLMIYVMAHDIVRMIG